MDYERGAILLLESLFQKVAPDMVAPDREFVKAFPNWETQYTWESVPNSCDTPNELMNFEMFWGIANMTPGEDISYVLWYELRSYIDYIHEEMYKNLKGRPLESFEMGLIDFSGPFAKIDVELLAGMALAVYKEYLAT